MARFILVASILLVSMAACSFAGVRDIGKELPFTTAINKKLCEPGTHSDSVAEQFYACYSEDITPGGSKFVECQKEVYGVELNSEENLDKACSLPKENFQLYAACLTPKLIRSGHRISDTWHKLNECQGAALNVRPPPSLESTIANIDRLF